jgi:signal transduction histidine kinase
MPQKGLRIRTLVVEDNPADALLLQHALQWIPDANFIVTCVETLEDAMSRLAATSFDVVLLDLGLPDSAGLETLTRLRQSQADVPVVVLTGLDDEAVGLSAVQMGAQDYLIKGRSPTAQLGRSIRYAIERKRAEQSAMGQIRESAVVGERSRIAGEIHDILAQDFVGILLQLEAAREFNGSNPQETAKCVELAEAVARSGLAEARRSVWALSPPELDAEGLVGAVQGFLSRVAAGNPNVVRLSVRGKPYQLPNDTALGLLRICQEAVVNSLRHAKADKIQVELAYQPSGVELCVEDNGRGFDPQATARSSGFGLTSMRQRAERICAKIEISARPGLGTRLSVVAPMPLRNPQGKAL